MSFFTHVCRTTGCFLAVIELCNACLISFKQHQTLAQWGFFLQHFTLEERFAWKQYLFALRGAEFPFQGHKFPSCKNTFMQNRRWNISFSMAVKVGGNSREFKAEQRDNRSDLLGRDGLCSVRCVQGRPAHQSVFTLSGSTTITYCRKNKLSSLRQQPRKSHFCLLLAAREKFSSSLSHSRRTQQQQVGLREKLSGRWQETNCGAEWLFLHQMKGWERLISQFMFLERLSSVWHVKPSSKGEPS